MTRFLLILLFAAASLGVAILAMTQAPASSKTPAAKTKPAARQAAESPTPCSTCPMPSN